MRKRLAYQPTSLRFKRWSRKGYAAFISTQRVVTIGQLASALTDRLLRKQLALHTGIQRMEEASVDLEEEGIGWQRDIPLPLSLLFLFIVTPLIEREVISAHPDRSLYIYTNKAQANEDRSDGLRSLAFFLS